MSLSAPTAKTADAHVKKEWAVDFKSNKLKESTDAQLYKLIGDFGTWMDAWLREDPSNFTLQDKVDALNDFKKNIYKALGGVKDGDEILTAAQSMIDTRLEITQSAIQGAKIDSLEIGLQVAAFEAISSVFDRMNIVNESGNASAAEQMKIMSTALKAVRKVLGENASKEDLEAGLIQYFEANPGKKAFFTKAGIEELQAEFQIMKQESQIIAAFIDHGTILLRVAQQLIPGFEEKTPEARMLKEFNEGNFDAIGDRAPEIAQTLAHFQKQITRLKGNQFAESSIKKEMSAYLKTLDPAGKAYVKYLADKTQKMRDVNFNMDSVVEFMKNSIPALVLSGGLGYMFGPAVAVISFVLSCLGKQDSSAVVEPKTKKAPPLAAADSRRESAAKKNVSSAA